MYQGPDATRRRTPNDSRSYEVTKQELPVHCPLPSMSLWNSHPQVYIPLESVGDHAICPYCGADYTLVSSAEGKS